jgi:hypothetical protein
VKGDKAVRQVLHQMAKIDPDSKVKLTVIRDGKAHEFTVTARPGPGRFARMPPPFLRREPGPPGGAPSGAPFENFAFRDFDFAPPIMIHGPLGDLELVSLTPQLGSYFGTDKGVLVVRAPKEDGFKLEDGDVILAIDGREPTSGSHATRILSSYQPGEKISLKLMRQHKTVVVETTLPEMQVSGPMPEPDRKGRVIRRQVRSAT